MSRAINQFFAAAPVDGVSEQNETPGKSFWGGITQHFKVAAASLLSGLLALAPVTARAQAAPKPIKLEWSAVSGAVSYPLFRSVGAEGACLFGQEVANVPGTSFTDANVTNNTTYYYAVKAQAPDGSRSADCGFNTGDNSPREVYATAEITPAGIADRVVIFDPVTSQLSTINLDVHDNVIAGTTPVAVNAGWTPLTYIPHPTTGFDTYWNGPAPQSIVLSHNGSTGAVASSSSLINSVSGWTTVDAAAAPNVASGNTITLSTTTGGAWAVVASDASNNPSAVFGQTGFQPISIPMDGSTATPSRIRVASNTGNYSSQVFAASGTGAVSIWTIPLTSWGPAYTDSTVLPKIGETLITPWAGGTPVDFTTTADGSKTYVLYKFGNDIGIRGYSGLGALAAGSLSMTPPPAFERRYSGLTSTAPQHIEAAPDGTLKVYSAPTGSGFGMAVFDATDGTYVNNRGIPATPSSKLLTLSH